MVSEVFELSWRIYLIAVQYPVLIIVSALCITRFGFSYREWVNK